MTSRSHYAKKPQHKCILTSNDINNNTTNAPYSYIQYKQIPQITGKELKHVPQQHKSNEVQKFHKINIQFFPNTKRVLSPDVYADNKMLFQRKHITKQPAFNKESKHFSLISKINYNIKPKPISPTFKESHDFTNECNGSSYKEHRTRNRFTPFGNYSTTTQIVNLPGCIKRNVDDIKDDTTMRKCKVKCRKVEYLCGNNNKQKCKRVSNIDCLNGSYYCSKTEESKRRNASSNRSMSDIFYLKPPCNKEHKGIMKDKGLLFNVTHKKIFPDKNNRESKVKEKVVKKNNKKNWSSVSFV